MGSLLGRLDPLNYFLHSSVVKWPLLNSFYFLDRPLQSLLLTAATSRGLRKLSKRLSAVSNIERGLYAYLKDGVCLKDGEYRLPFLLLTKTNAVGFPFLTKHTTLKQVLYILNNNWGVQYLVITFSTSAGVPSGPGALILQRACSLQQPFLVEQRKLFLQVG